jgi:hypothetical protein
MSTCVSKVTDVAVVAVTCHVLESSSSRAFVHRKVEYKVRVSIFNL